MRSEKAPVCIGIILDGNRRWAQEHGLSALEGHRRGFENVEPILLAARRMGISHMVVYAFSTENWKRSRREVSYLMRIFEQLANEKAPRLQKKGVAVRFIGQRERWPKSLRNAIHRAESKNPRTPHITLWWCLSYGGRADIVQAAQRAARTKKLTEKVFAKQLWTAGMPDPDLIVRSGGDMRFSNFLLWQASYSELFFTKKYWPAFSFADLKRILREYAARERRMGA